MLRIPTAMKLANEQVCLSGFLLKLTRGKITNIVWMN